MAYNATLAARYTDERYLTKKNLIATIGTSMIDALWRDIDQYRKDHSIETDLLTVSRKHFCFTATEMLKIRYSGFSKRLELLANRFAAISSDPDYCSLAEKDAMLTILCAASTLEGSKMSELSIKAVLSGMYRENNPDHAPILRYRSALLGMKDSFLRNRVNEGFLGECLQTILGTEDLLEFYRTKDPISVNQMSLVGRNYDFAPCRDIESMMESLWRFASSPMEEVFLKAMGIYFYFDYVKPFASHNALLGCLLAKQILSSAYGESMLLLPLEKILAEGLSYKTLSAEAQKEADLTYVFLHAIESMDSAIDVLINDFVNVKKTVIAHEYKDIPKEEAKPSEPAEPVEVKVEAPRAEIREVPIEAKPSDAKEEAEEAPSGALAAVTPRSGLSEKEIKEAARYILETNPRIRKAQATFFASHCAIGRYYTIQDFKRFARCAYETARTSMDNLAREGFYKKLQVKNKFVYTPIQQGDQES